VPVEELRLDVVASGYALQKPCSTCAQLVYRCRRGGFVVDGKGARIPKCFNLGAIAPKYIFVSEHGMELLSGMQLTNLWCQEVGAIR